MKLPEFTVVLHVRPGHDNQAGMANQLMAVLDAHGFLSQYALTSFPGAPNTVSKYDMSECSIEAVKDREED